MIETKLFDRLNDGTAVLAFTISDGESYVRILNYGATIQSLVVPDKYGRPLDIVLGYDTIGEYVKNGGCLGATIGRFANRIQEGKLILDGKKHQLACNKNGNHIHGGNIGFHKKLWNHEIDGDELTLSLFSPDGEENYPGNLTVRVTFTFNNGELNIHYNAVSDKKTAINLTNHVYFNLNGAKDGDIKDNKLWLDSDYITPTDETMLPTGGFRTVKGTPFDFNEIKSIGRDIAMNDVDLKKGNGYDHCYLLKNQCGEYVKYAEAISRRTGIRMTCYTDMPAVQLYTGNGLNQKGKEGYYKKYSGFCLETEAIPNNVNIPEYAEKGSSIYDAGQVYDFTATYKFEYSK